MTILDPVVIGAGQAGLAASYFLRQRGIDHVVVPDYFGDYERRHHVPVVRPVRVDRVESDGDLLFMPFHPGIASFAGEQVHTPHYPGALGDPARAGVARGVRGEPGPAPGGATSRTGVQPAPAEVVAMARLSGTC